MKKRLDAEQTFQEIVNRIHRLNIDSKRKWGVMKVEQMMLHCDKVLQVACGKISLPKVNFLLYGIGILTKKEMAIFNNGIPPNMPTFRKLIVNFECSFEDSKSSLLKTLYEFKAILESGEVPNHHCLFGKMTLEDWAFLEYKHLHHHLKQFGV